MDEEVEEFAAATTTLTKICEVGEALARANSDAHYPSARDDWERAKEEITRVLGVRGVERIQEHMVENCERYLAFAPHIFRGAMVVDPVGRFARADAREVENENPFIAGCRPFLQTRLRALYRERREGNVRRTCLVALAREIAPLSGFHRGCVYTIEPASMLLVPQLTVGSAKLEEFAPIAYWASQAAKSTVDRAFQSGEVVVNPVLCENEEVAVNLSFVLGGSQRIGVVVLEMSSGMYHADREQHLVHFKAIIQAFNDCLTLRKVARGVSKHSACLTYSRIWKLGMGAKTTKTGKSRQLQNH